MFPFLLTCVLAVLSSVCLCTEETSVEEVTLPPEVIEAMNGEKMVIDKCFKQLKHELHNAGRILMMPTIRHGFKQHRSTALKMTGLKPCSACYVINRAELSGNITQYANYQYKTGDMMNYLTDTVIGIAKLDLECDDCEFTDEHGINYSGSFHCVWSEPRVNVIATDRIITDDDPEGDTVEFTKTKILLINATNVDREAINGTCHGDEDFMEVCKKGHRNGESDQIFHDIAKNLITFDHKYFPEESETALHKLHNYVLSGFACSFHVELHPLH